MQANRISNEGGDVRERLTAVGSLLQHDAANADAATRDGIRLLVVEDDVDQLELLRDTIEQHFGVGTVQSVHSRAAAAGCNLEAFDLIVADYNLPDATGMELLDDVSRRCTTPIILVTGENVGRTAAEAIQRGATDYIVKAGDYLFTIPLVIEKNLSVAKVRRENERLRHQLEAALLQLRFKNAQLEESLQRVEQMAATDALTGLYNRRHFNRVLEQMFAEAHRMGHDLTCVMLDLDDYKRLNDTCGHQVGDELLTVAGKVITANLRRMDVAARYGGDEFVLLLPHASADEARGVMERVREDFYNASRTMLTARPGVSTSVGVATLLGSHAMTPEQLVSHADAALYRAKENGRNRIECAPAPAALSA